MTKTAIPEHWKLCNCADCGQLMAGEQMRRVAKTYQLRDHDMEWIGGRVKGRPYCSVCLEFKTPAAMVQQNGLVPRQAAKANRTERPVKQGAVMAEEIKEFTFTKGSYLNRPWHKWTNGKIWKLKKGEDFTCTMLSFHRELRGQAKRSGLLVKSAYNGGFGNEFIVFQFSEKPCD